jgi:hypothetical protein
MALVLDIFQAATLLRASAEKASLLAQTGELPATSIGPDWIFLEGDLVNFLLKKIARETAARRELSASTPKSRKGRRRNPIPDLTKDLVKVPGF